MPSFEYQAASFRGVPFAVLAQESSGGRDGPVHEYVGQDEGFFEDTGRKSRRWRLSGYVSGVDHLRDAEALVAACEARGSGNLILPNGDVVAAVCTDFSERLEPRTQGGRTRFELTFVEANDYTFPTAITSLIGAIEDQFNAILAQARAVVGLPAAVAGSIDGAFSVGFQTGGQTYRPGSGPADELERVANQENAGPDLAISVDDELVATDLDDGLRDTFRAATLTAGVSMFSGYGFQNRTEAEGIRDAFVDRLDDVISRADNETAAQLSDVRRAFLADAAARVLTLPQFDVVNLGASCPAVVAAHRIFGDYTRWEDLMSWNPSTIHPLFMPAQVEVLRD